MQYFYLNNWIYPRSQTPTDYYKFGITKNYANRTANFLKHNTDKTIHDFPHINKIYNASNSLDFTNLSKKDQDALFIGDKIFGGMDFNGTDDIRGTFTFVMSYIVG